MVAGFTVPCPQLCGGVSSETSRFALEHTLVLFAVSLFEGNGLVISATFRLAKVIYIVIPLLSFPNHLWGAIIRFERFNLAFSHVDAPWFGNIMASRWGFEALAVDLARNNPYDESLAMWEDRIYQAGWRRDFWLAELKSTKDADLVMSELDRSAEELRTWEGSEFDWPWASPEEVDWQVVKDRFNAHYKDAFAARTALREDMSSKQDLVVLKNNSHNDELWEWVLQDDRKERALWVNGELIQKSGPVHRSSIDSSGLASTMYAPYKSMAGGVIQTLGYNVLVLLAMSTMMWLLLLLQPWIAGKPWVRRQKTSPQA